MPGAGKVADLVLTIACGLQLPHGVQVKICGGIGIGQAGGRVAVKCRARLYL